MRTSPRLQTRPVILAFEEEAWGTRFNLQPLLPPSFACLSLPRNHVAGILWKTGEDCEHLRCGTIDTRPSLTLRLVHRGSRTRPDSFTPYENPTDLFYLTSTGASLPVPTSYTGMASLTRTDIFRSAILITTMPSTCPGTFLQHSCSRQMI